METVFPANDGYKSLFLIGFRKSPVEPDTIERTGTAVLKRTYDMDSVAGALKPATAPFPVFLRDHPDNLVLNSHFELLEDGLHNKPLDWDTEGDVTIESAPLGANRWLKVTGEPNGRVIQTLDIGEPLGGRQFFFSFLAKAEPVPARIEDVQLEAAGHVLCAQSIDLNTTLDHRYCASGTWPAELQATTMRVVLRAATDSTHAALYDNVQVEQRDHQTTWDDVTTLRYEHDLASYKPEGDLIVLGFTEEPSPSASITIRASVNEQEWFRRTLSDAERVGAQRPKAAFGWEPRAEDERKGEAGTCEPPLDNPLPHDFRNRFFNGCRRTTDDGEITAHSPFPYLTANARIQLQRGQTAPYTFTLRGDTATAVYYYYSGTGPDVETFWRKEPVTMNIDTLVVEPDRNRCYLVWRGVWPFDQHDEGSYRRLVVKAST